MEKTSNYHLGTWVAEILLIVIGLIFLVPFYFLLVNSIKSFGDILAHSASWPTTFRFENYANAWNKINFPTALGNSLIVTIVSNALLLLISSMAAYQMVRHDTPFNRFTCGSNGSSLSIDYVAAYGSVQRIELKQQYTRTDPMLSGFWGAFIRFSFSWLY